MNMTIEELAALSGKSAAYLKKINGEQPPGKKLLKKSGQGYDLVIFFRRYAEIQNSINRNEMLLRELAVLVGYTERRIQQINAELTAEKKLLVKGDGGRYDLPTFVRNWAGYCVAKEKGETDINYDDIRARHEQLKMEKTQIELAVRKGELVEAEAALALWSDIAITFRSRMLFMATKLAPKLVMLEEPKKIKDIITKEVRKTLQLLSECKLPEAEWKQTEEKEEVDE